MENADSLRYRRHPLLDADEAKHRKGILSIGLKYIYGLAVHLPKMAGFLWIHTDLIRKAIYQAVLIVRNDKNILMKTMF